MIIIIITQIIMIIIIITQIIMIIIITITKNAY